MADTLLPIPLSEGEWVDLYAQSGIPVGTRIRAGNIGSHLAVFYSGATAPVGAHGEDPVRPWGYVENSLGDKGAWAKSEYGEGLFLVSIAPVTDVSVVTSDSKVSVQNPFPTNGDSVYSKDINVSLSGMGDFSGVVTDLFDDLNSVVINVTANNPKDIIIHLERTVSSDSVDLGAVVGDFSNVGISTAGSDHVFTSQIDESLDNTKHQSRLYRFETTIEFNLIKLSFSTIDTVTLSNCVILKSARVVARQHGPNGLEYAQDIVTGDRVNIDHPHAKIHEGRNYTSFADDPTATSVIMAFRVESQGLSPHMTVDWKTEESGTVKWYKGATWTQGSGTNFIPINSNHFSANTSILQGNSSGAFLSNEIVINPAGLSIAGAILLFQESVWATNQSPAAAGSSNRKEQVLLPGETYVIEITGSPLGGIWGLLDWYEQKFVGG